jgi:hypothetical protein
LLLDEPLLGLAPMIVQQVYPGNDCAADGVERPYGTLRRGSRVRVGDGPNGHAG